MSSKDGWYEDHELALLNAVAEKAPRLPYLEVGVYKGRSAEILIRHTDQLVLCDNLSLGDSRVEWPVAWRTCDDVRAASALVPQFGLIHHDADHSFEVVRDHLCLLMPKVAIGGYLCLHDFDDPTYPGVAEGYREAVRITRTVWRPIQRAGTLQVLKRENEEYGR